MYTIVTGPWSRSWPGNQTLLQLDQRLRHGVSECARDKLEWGGRIASGPAHTLVLENARRDHLRQVGFWMLPHGVDQFLDLSPVEELREQGLELARGRSEMAVLC